MKDIIGQAKITRGGQVTLSKKVRDVLGVDVGSYVIFQIDGKKLVIMPAEIKPIANNVISSFDVLRR